MQHPSEFGPCTWCARPAVVEVRYSRLKTARRTIRAARYRAWPGWSWRWQQLLDLGAVLAGALTAPPIERRACVRHLAALWAEMTSRWEVER
jgi:hypothetical protein